MSLKGIVLGTALAAGIVGGCAKHTSEVMTFEEGMIANCELRLGPGEYDVEPWDDNAWLIKSEGGTVSYEYSDVQRPVALHEKNLFCKIELSNRYFSWVMRDYGCDTKVDYSNLTYTLKPHSYFTDLVYSNGGIGVTFEELKREDAPKLFEQTYDELFKNLKYKTMGE